MLEDNAHTPRSGPASAIPIRLLTGSAYDSTTAHMQALLTHFEETSDRRCIFLDCYSRMTANMLAGLEAGRFQDREWVEGLLHHFAGYYFAALRAYEQGAPETPAVWRLTHDAAGRDAVSVLQHLLLGVNAHINYDLVLAVRDRLIQEWPRQTPAQRERRFADHMLVNQIISETVDGVQDEVVERYCPLLDIVDKLGGPVDEWLAAHIIGAWRHEVWTVAAEMLECAGEAAVEQVRLDLEARALQRAQLILLGK